jgi:uncharacterized protein YfaT (DUF1175 family)
MCTEYTYESDMKTLAHPKAMRTAHDLAMKKSESATGEFEKVDVYLLYFRRIYDHELKRNMKILYAREELACLVRNLDKEVCSYHQESQAWYESDEFGKKKDYLKDAEREYRETKWPKGGSQ